MGLIGSDFRRNSLNFEIVIEVLVVPYIPPKKKIIPASAKRTKGRYILHPSSNDMRIRPIAENTAIIMEKRNANLKSFTIRSRSLIF